MGGGHPIHTDARLIAATNRDLNAAGANGTFRQDLLCRLKTLLTLRRIVLRARFNVLSAFSVGRFSLDLIGRFCPTPEDHSALGRNRPRPQIKREAGVYTGRTWSPKWKSRASLERGPTSPRI